MTLADYVKNNFNGMLVFGDVHADYVSYMKAFNYAEANKLFFMSIGDLVDRGHYPFETVSHMHENIKAGLSGFTIGNHDDKFRRLFLGNKVSLSTDAKRTLEDVGTVRRDNFLKMYYDIMETPIYAGIFHKLDDITIVHAASHPAMWEDKVDIGKTARNRALVGEAKGEIDADGFPVRLYNWIDEIPMGKTVIVGHDRKPIFNVAITEPLVRTNANGGEAIFIDTGCGKGGFLTGAVITYDIHFKIDHYEVFK